MKLTLLEIVQDILNDLDADSVNSIDDTVEAGQVAQIVKTCYNEMVSNRNWPHLKKLLQLDASNDIEKPNYLKLPENLEELTMVKYLSSSPNDGTVSYKELTYLYPDEFLARVAGTTSNSPNVEEIVDYSGISFFIANNKAPTYWTSFDDSYLVTDSYDKSEDDTLKKSKTQAIGYVMPSWEMADDFVPDLPSSAFAALVEEAKSTAFYTLKQTANQKAEQKSARQQRWLSRKSWRAKGGVRYEDYGRKSRK